MLYDGKRKTRPFVFSNLSTFSYDAPFLFFPPRGSSCMASCAMRMASLACRRQVARVGATLQNVPGVLGRVAELAAGHARRETEVADGDLLVDELVGEGIFALGHGAHEDADALLGAHALDPVPHPHHLGVEAERDLAAVGRQVVGDGVLDDAQQLLLRRRRPNREAVQQLDHQTGEALEGTGNADGGRDLNQDALGRVDVDLQFASLVDGRVKQGKETLGRLAQSAC